MREYLHLELFGGLRSQNSFKIIESGYGEPRDTIPEDRRCAECFTELDTVVRRYQTSGIVNHAHLHVHVARKLVMLQQFLELVILSLKHTRW